MYKLLMRPCLYTVNTAFNRSGNIYSPYRRYRYRSYHSFVSWCWGHLGWNLRQTWHQLLNNEGVTNYGEGALSNTQRVQLYADKQSLT